MSEEVNIRYYIKPRDKILEYNRNWRKQNNTASKEIDRRCYAKHKNERVEYGRKHRSENREKTLEQHRNYYIRHRDKILKFSRKYNFDHRERLYECSKKRFNERYQTDLGFNLECRISGAIRVALKGNKSGRHWEDLVGYTLTRLKEHLQNTIPKGYTWKDYLKGILHIDHIVPKSFFKYTKSEDPEFKKCWSLDNLQLLTKEENRQKWNKLNYVIQGID